jgi:trk system potassium uptake protein TrkH
MPEERIKVLIYAVRWHVVLKYGAQLALMLGILSLVPLVCALWASNSAVAERYSVLSGGLILVGGALSRLPAPTSIRANEALTVTTLLFILTPVLMAWPLMESDVPYIDALFEAVSGVTTTGLSTLGSIENRSSSFLFARAWMQWYGGLGIVIMSVALMMGHQVATRQLIDPVDSGDSLISTARAHARRMLWVYGALTIVGVLIVWSLNGNAFVSLLHVLSAVSTGGFSSFDTSLTGALSKPSAVAISVISLMGAVSLPLYWRTVHSGWRRGIHVLISNVELHALLISVLIVGSVLGVLAYFQESAEPWYHGFMLGLSAQTTTGFATGSLNELDSASSVIVIISMLTGGSIGSSAGGMKLLRILILFRLIHLTLQRTALPPHAVATLTLGGQRLESDDVIKALQVMLLYLVLLVISWWFFVFMEYDPLDALFEVASAIGTVGLSSGITRPELETPLKALLCFDMLAGRLEIVALLIVLFPRNWLGRKGDN